MGKRTTRTGKTEGRPAAGLTDARLQSIVGDPLEQGFEDGPPTKIRMWPAVECPHCNTPQAVAVFMGGGGESNSMVLLAKNEGEMRAQIEAIPGIEQLS